MEENTNVVNTSTTEKEGSKFGWGVLGFFFPVIGMIIAIVYVDKNRKTAKASCIGVLIYIIISYLYTIIKSVMSAL